MKALRLRESADCWARVCTLLEIEPLASLRDPVGALRIVASSGEDRLNDFLQLVLVDAPGFDDFASEDEARLYAAAVFAVLANRERARLRHAQHAYKYVERTSPGDEARALPNGAPLSA